MVPSPIYTPDDLHRAESDFAARHALAGINLDALDAVRRRQPCEGMDAARRMTCWIAAPVLAGFARWMLEQSAHHGHPPMLGVMREGRMLCRLVEVLSESITQKPQEIWLNRHLTMLAAFGCGDDEALINWLARTRLQPVTAAQASRHLLNEEIPAGQGDKPLDADAAYRLVGGWKQNGRLDRLRKDCLALAARLMRHWRSVTDDAKKIMLMDFACAGNIQRALQTVLTAQGDKTEVIGLNFAMTSGSIWATQAGCVMRGYLSEKGEPAWFADAYARTPELMEIFAAALDGPLHDYAADGTALRQPGFLTKQQQTTLTVLQSDLIEAALFYHRELGAGLTAQLSRCLWGRLLLEPLAAEAVALADWPLDAGLDGAAQRLLAPRLSLTAAIPDKMQSAWPAASRILADL